MRNRLASAPRTNAVARPTATILIRSVSCCISTCATAALGIAVWRMRATRSNRAGKRAAARVRGPRRGVEARTPRRGPGRARGRGLPAVADLAVHERTAEAERREVAVRELAVGRVAEDVLVGVLVEHVVGAQGQVPVLVGAVAGGQVEQPLGAVGLVERRVVGGGAHAAVAGGRGRERPVLTVPGAAQQ